MKAETQFRLTAFLLGAALALPFGAFAGPSQLGDKSLPGSSDLRAPSAKLSEKAIKNFDLSKSCPYCYPTTGNGGTGTGAGGGFGVPTPSKPPRASGLAGNAGAK
jgi:hypothetical protein